MCNTAIRNAIQSAGVRHWMVADKLGVSETTFCRMLRKELSEDSLYELDKIFNKIEIGNTIIIKFYKNRIYKEINGTVTNIDYNKKKIQINKTQNINISDIIKILI